MIGGLMGFLGAFLGITLWHFHQKKVLASSRSRTRLDFISGKKIWSDLECWGNKEGWKLKSNSETERMYKKGSFCLLVQHDDDKVHAEAWVEMHMFFIKQEVAIDEAVLLCSFFYPKVIMQINRLLVILESPVKIREFCKQRTGLEVFASDKKIWCDVERWAKEKGYKLKSCSETERIYKRDSSFWTVWRSDASVFASFFSAPPSSCLLICQGEDRIHIEAWMEVCMLASKWEIAADEEDMLRKKVWKENAVRINRLLVALESPIMLKEV